MRFKSKVQKVFFAWKSIKKGIFDIISITTSDFSVLYNLHFFTFLAVAISRKFAFANSHAQTFVTMTKRNPAYVIGTYKLVFTQVWLPYIEPECSYRASKMGQNFWVMTLHKSLWLLVFGLPCVYFGWKPFKMLSFSMFIKIVFAPGLSFCV